MPAPGDPMAVARVLVADYRTADGLTLRNWRGQWMRWVETHWTEVEHKVISAAAYERLEHAEYLDDSGKIPEKKPWRPNRRKIADLLDALTAITHLPETVDPPSWLDRNGPQTGAIVACTNGLLDVSTRELHPLTPKFYNTVSVPFAYNPDAPEPARWLDFLAELWPDDEESIKALREFIGYVLSGRTDMHKIMLLIGPTRSGKGTIARVLGALLGKGNVAGPTLASLGTNFGLSALLGKPLAVVSDARLSGANVHQVVERLLSISGEDTLTIDRKYREPWTGKLSSRFVILSNELPRFGDASGAIANRFLVLSMHNSFLGRENTKLTSELLAELPGILSWALDGLDELTTSGSFTRPAASDDAILALQDLVSPVAAFVRDQCSIGVESVILASGLYTVWKTWCEDTGNRPGSAQNFGRDLRAVVPAIRIERPWNDDGTRGPRHYRGIAASTAHNAPDRGPKRSDAADETPGPLETAVKPIVGSTHDERGGMVRPCPECDQPLPAGKVRHPECFQSIQRGA